MTTETVFIASFRHSDTRRDLEQDIVLYQPCRPIGGRRTPSPSVIEVLADRRGRELAAWFTPARAFAHPVPHQVRRFDQGALACQQDRGRDSTVEVWIKLSHNRSSRSGRRRDDNQLRDGRIFERS